MKLLLILLPLIYLMPRLVSDPTMGVYMAVRGCLDAAGGPDPGSLGITAALLAVMLGYRAAAKKELSPILLICISGLLGILVYGV